MAAGKTTIGERLARQIGFEFIDLDDVIEAAEGMTIAQIFEKGKEELFREIEHRELVKLLERTGIVVALGGGTFIQERNRKLLLEHAFVVFIDTPLDIIRKRVMGDTKRPLLQQQKAGDLYKLFMTRQPLYRKAPTHVNGRKSVLGIVNEILRYLIDTQKETT